MKYCKMSNEEIKKFRTHIYDIMSGNISEAKQNRIKEQWIEINNTYEEFLKANNRKNPIINK